MPNKLDYDFFHRPCLTVAQALVGKILAHRMPDGTVLRLRISETESYCGEDDTACHAHKGRTKRTEVLYADAGTIYVYLCYGIHWLLNIVSGEKEHPQAVLIRACEGAEGPGRLTKALGITGELNRSHVCSCDSFWLEDDGSAADYFTAPRIGIGYASPADQALPWRFILKK